VAEQLLAAEPVTAIEPTPVVEVLEIVEPGVAAEVVPVETIIVAVEPEVEEEPLEVIEVIDVVEAVPLANGTPEVRAPRRRATPTRPAARSRAGHRFVVEYCAERVLRAADIRDAMRQASALGASEVLSITRES
jgi:hypothetical protein